MKPPESKPQLQGSRDAEGLSPISAVILAAGESKRMGQPKMLLPWGENTVLQTVLITFRRAGVEDILVVTGAIHERIEDLAGDLARTVFNPDFAAGEMLSSIQAGLRALDAHIEAALIGLGDQPQVRAETVGQLLEARRQSGCALAVPSYNQRRGHPWLVGRPYWEEILSMRPGKTMRDFFRRHAAVIHYVEVQDASVLADLDTPEDYSKYRP